MSLTKHNNNSISNITSFAQVPAGKPVLLSTATASSSSSIEFTSGIDSTYDVYQFEFINMHPQNNGSDFMFNYSTDNGSNYNVTKTSTVTQAYHQESDANAGLVYQTLDDLAQSTAFQTLTANGDTTGSLSNANDSSYSGFLLVFNPSSTTYVKHWISRGNNMTYDFFYSVDTLTAGYGNTTSAVNAIKFQMSSGNIDAGTIKMYGISA